MQPTSSDCQQPDTQNAGTITRRAIIVQGVVQGVGFRPFVYGLATRRELGGFVRNEAAQVRIEVEGRRFDIDAFIRELQLRPPCRARIDDVKVYDDRCQGTDLFHIEGSCAKSGSGVLVSADIATCDACLTEMFDRIDRRFRYPFLNCTQCGPRLTIIKAAPYDRERTTMAGFEMCGDCRNEYESRSNRRFHAQPTACPTCGPRLNLRDLSVLGTLGDSDPTTEVCRALARGEIIAIKGLGGYHLATDARNELAVANLRQRKHRYERPFAVMVADATAANRMCVVSRGERVLLESPRGPIVLLQRRTAEIAASVAPGHPWLGVMLPYTPLHHLLLDRLSGMPLVMTSGNQSDEPIAFDDDDAFERLNGIADIMLTHDRPICIRCDDSVTRIVAGTESVIRRSRGYAPESRPLPLEVDRPILAVGGQLKNTFALGVGQHAILSHHIGDLDHLEAVRSFRDAVVHYQGLFDVTPSVIAHDRHPEYASTLYAAELVQTARVADIDPPQLVGVQHHHAHMASCMAEHVLNETCIGVTFDGTGYGSDETIWGGEFLIGDYTGFHRAAHLRLVPLPGGESAIREPWRMAFSHLVDSGADTSFVLRTPQTAQLNTLRRMLDRRINSPLTSSAGRLFDAVAVLAGLRECVSYEGQIAIELEDLATDVDSGSCYEFELQPGHTADDPVVVDTRPLIACVVQDVRRGTEARIISRRFHTSVIEIITQVCLRLRDSSGIETVVLSGGVFLNSLLLSEVPKRLEGAGFRVYRHENVPTNDGGLSLGQLAVAAATLQMKV